MAQEKSKANNIISAQDELLEFVGTLPAANSKKDRIKVNGLSQEITLLINIFGYEEVMKSYLVRKTNKIIKEPENNFEIPDFKLTAIKGIEDTPNQLKANDSRKRVLHLLRRRKSAIFRQDHQDCIDFLNSDSNNLNYDINSIERSLYKHSSSSKVR